MFVKPNTNFIFYALVLFLLYLYARIISNQVLLADDLGKVYEGITNQCSFLDFIKKFMSGLNMTSRPVSGFFTAIVIYGVKWYVNFYYVGLLFFIVSLFFVREFFKVIISNLQTANIATCIYAMLPIGTSVMFSPIMLNSALATTFFCSAVVVFLRGNASFWFWSAVLFCLSFLSYEIFAPCIIFFVFLKRKTQEIVYFICTVIIILLVYKKLIEPSIFKNYYQREDFTSALNINKNIKSTIFIGKMLLRDLPVTFYNGLTSITRFSYVDFSILFFLNGVAIWQIFKNQFHFNGKYFIGVLITLTASFGIFYFSTYIPTLFGFDNRNLGAIRLFSGCILVLIICKYLTKKMQKILLSLIIIVGSITLIGIKNAWVYANEFNNKMFQEVGNAVDKYPSTKSVYIKYNIYHEVSTNPKFILREHIFYYPWESKYLILRNGLNNRKIHLLPDDGKVPEKSYILYDYDRKKTQYIVEK